MQGFVEGDTVRIDIPDLDDPDHEPFHGRHGVVVDVLQDAPGSETGDERDSVLYKVEFEDGKTMDFRWRDLRPSGFFDNPGLNGSGWMIRNMATRTWLRSTSCI